MKSRLPRLQGLVHPPLDGVDIYQRTPVYLLLSRQADGKGLPDLVRLWIENDGTNGEYYRSQLGG